MSGDAIRYGLSAIKSVGKPVTEVILAERERNGPFRSMEDFVGRMSMKEVNKRTLENFIKSGALDTCPEPDGRRWQWRPPCWRRRPGRKNPCLRDS